MIATCLNPAAFAREAERLRHMARRARRSMDAPIGWTFDRYADRLERQACDLMARRIGLDS
jgi:hypothetical protein